MFGLEMKFHLRLSCSIDFKKLRDCGFYLFNEYIKGTGLKDEASYVRAFGYPN